MAFGPIDAILLFGDSLTQGGWDAGGFAQRLAYVYARKLDVINRGLSGYNSEWAFPVFEKIMPKAGESGAKVKLLTIWLGANDCCLPPSPQCCPIPRFIDNLKLMIAMVWSPSSTWYSPETSIILITPPAMSAKVRARELAKRDPPQECDRSNENTKAYADAVLELGKELELPTVDLYTAMWEAAKGDDELKELSSDGLHLATPGYTILFDLLIECIRKNYPELDYETLPMVYPPWKELLDPKDRFD